MELLILTSLAFFLAATWHSFARFSPAMIAVYLGFVPFVAAPTLKYVRDKPSWVSQGELDLVVFLIMVGIVCFLLGCATAKGAPRRHRTRGWLYTERRDRLCWFAVFCASIGVLGILVGWASMGGLGWVMSQPYGALAANRLTMTALHRIMWYLPGWFLPVGASLAIALLISERLPLIRRAVLLCVVLALVVYSLLYGVRGYLLHLLLSYIGALVLQSGPRRVNARKWFHVGAVAVLIFSGVVYLTITRDWGAGFSIASFWGSVLDFSWLTAVERSLDMVDEMLVIASHVPRDQGYLCGQTFLLPIVNFVPREYWRGKPIGMGKMVAEWQGFPEDSAVVSGVPIMGELYANFGTAGALVGMFLFGLAATAIYYKYGRSPYLMFNVAYLLFASRLPSIVRGDFLNATFHLAIWEGIIFLAWPLIRKNRGNCCCNSKEFFN